MKQEQTANINRTLSWQNMLRVLFITVLVFLVHSPLQVSAKNFKVLVVVSYEPTFSWVVEVREGIESVLNDKAEVKYIYLHTKENLADGPKRAAEAYQTYLDYRPDGVITVDDNAQSMFAVPYLKDKVKTPVMFCGVNAPPEKYGYPASNVSGILERQHFGEAIAMMKQVLPSLKTVGFMMKASPTADLIIEELRHETYLAQVISFATPHTVAEAMKMVDEMQKSCDAIYITNLTGLTDDSGTSLSDDILIPMVANRFGKPLFSGSSYNINFPGVLVAVAKTGQEQGSTAARMLLKAMNGIPVNEIPITRNRFGKRMLNVTTLQNFGLPAKPSFFRSTEVVRSKQ